MLFLVTSSFLYPMHRFQQNLKRVSYTIPVLGLGYIAQQYYLGQGFYEQLLEKKVTESGYDKSLQGKDEVFFSKEPLLNNLILETRITNYPYEGRCMQGSKIICAEKNMLFSMKRKEQIAFVSYRVTDKMFPKKSCECYISQLETNKDCRMQGYATLLLQAIEKEAREAGCSRIKLTAVQSAIPFYEKRGFKVQEHQSMEKILAAAKEECI